MVKENLRWSKPLWKEINGGSLEIGHNKIGYFAQNKLRY
jgi:hypothetical protein